MGSREALWSASVQEQGSERWAKSKVIEPNGIEQEPWMELNPPKSPMSGTSCRDSDFRTPNITQNRKPHNCYE